MKLNKKILTAGAIITMALPLAACGKKVVATTNGGDITQSAYYNSLKNTPQGKTVLQSMILNKCLETQYGNKVSNKDVDKQYQSYQKQYGQELPTMMQKEGMTESSLKTSIKNNLLLKQAVIDNTQWTTQDLEGQFKKDKIKKGTYKDYEPRLKDELANSKMADNNAMKAVISKVLQNGNVKIKDKDLSGVMNQFNQPQNNSSQPE